MSPVFYNKFSPIRDLAKIPKKTKYGQKLDINKLKGIFFIYIKL